jgi:hypothetical protein
MAHRIQGALKALLFACSACGAAPNASPDPSESPGLLAQAETVACPSAGAPRQVGKLTNSELTEASGLVEGRLNSGLFYTHNDSGGAARVYAINEAAELVATVNYSGARAQDWEDIAIGPGPDPSTSYIYVGDVGDNAQSRSEVRVLRSAEPRLDPSARGQSVSVTYDTIRLRYPDGAHNCESLFVDPSTGDLYLLTKESSGASGLYVGTAPLSTSSVNTLTRTAGFAFGTAPLSGSRLATAADMSSNGTAALVRTYTHAFLWMRPAGASVSATFSAAPCSVPVASEPQGEAIAFAVDGSRVYTLSEGAGAALYRVDLAW